MKRRLVFGIGGVLAIGLLLQAVVTLQAQQDAAVQAQLFEGKVRPVLAASCFSCHSSSAAGGLRLDSREGLLKGGESGPAIVVGDPEKSLLLSAVRHIGEIKMPMGGERLTDEQIADLAAWIKGGAVWPQTQAGAKPEPVLNDQFETHIRPVLAQQCFACHTSTKAGGLRLDSREGLLAGGKTGPAIVPGDPDKSLLLAAIKHSGTLRMPKGATRMTDEQIGQFTEWIKDGAFWPVEKSLPKTYTAAEKEIWSIQPLQNPPVPSPKDASWAVNDIDRFVLARLEKEGLTPAAPTDRRTLLRRATYDLTGLMPSHEQVAAFEKDAAPDAWEKQIDRLLASPQYGERWARHWMDVVRYGEDDYRVGKRPDRAEKYPFAYLYRDWLIRALNEDITYDMFVKAQLAGDLLDEKIRDKHIPALGMHGNGIWIFHASPAPVERADEWHDKVDVTTKAFLGMTVGCARCHDHKYDAVYTKDYYSLISVFASSRFKAYPQVPKSVVDEYEKQNKILEKKNADLRKFLENASALYAQMLFSQTESYMLAAWKVGSQKRATVESVAEETKLDPELLQRWIRFLKKKPDNYDALKAWQEMVARGGKEEEAKKLAADFYAKVAEVNEKQLKIVKENEVTLAQAKDSEEIFDPLPNGLKRLLNRYQVDLKSLERTDNLLWRDVFEFDVPEATAEEPEEGERRKPGLLKLTEGALERRLSADLKMHVDRIRADIDAFKKSMPPQYPSVYGIEEAKEPADLKVFVRGNPYAFGEDAPRAFPSLLSGGEQKLFTKGSGRLELAEEIIKQPITARVIVNRIWRWHMGRGISDTPSNFGVVGERPTNPELLEYLASKFVADGMSWKKLHKDILMSRTYQLSTNPVPANLKKDPENKYFWRANRSRIEAEGVWDLLLQASGALDLKFVGGQSEDLSDKMVRRGVYAKVSRMYPSPFQATFDVPPATISVEKRYLTNIPQQRLFFLNNTFVHNQAELLAARVKSAGDEEAQVKKAFAIVYQREPTPEELAASVAFIRVPPMPAASAPPAAMPAASMAAASAASPASVGRDFSPANDKKDEPKQRPDSPLRSFCWALLSSNEFLYLD